MSSCCLPYLIGLFLKLGLITEQFAETVDGSVRIPAGCSRDREALSQDIARPPVSLNKLLVEDHAATVRYHTAYKEYPTHYPRTRASVQRSHHP